MERSGALFLKWCLIALSFCTAFFAFSYSGKVYRAVKLRSCSVQDGDCFCDAPGGYFLFRGDIYTPESVKRWKQQVNMDVKETEFALFSLGMYSFHVEKNYPKAIKYFEKVMTDFPTDSIAASALFECGVCQMIAGFGEAGQRTLKSFCSTYSDSWRFPAARMYIGIYHRENGNPDMAISIFESIVQQYPQSPQYVKALLALVDIYKENGNEVEGRRVEMLLSSHRVCEPRVEVQEKD